MPQHNYTTDDWLREAAGDFEACDYDNDSDDHSPWDLDGWFYDGDARYYRPGEGILGAEVYRHSNNESQEPVEPAQISGDNDDRAQDELGGNQPYTVPTLALLERLRRPNHHRPSVPEEHHSSSESEPSSNADELYCSPDHPTSNDTQQAHHGHDDVLNQTEEMEVVAESPESAGTSTTEDRSLLAKTTKDGIADCEKAKSDSCTKKNDAMKDAHQSFNVENESMNEWYENIKAEEVILGKRIALHVRLPTNQVVTPAHNALVEEDVKEMMLIADSFKAVKTKKADIRATLKARIEKAEEVYDGECAAWDQQMACLRNMAELSGIELDGEEAEDDLLSERVAQVIRLQSSTPAHSTSHAREPASSHARSKPSTAANSGRRQKVEAAKSTVQEDCLNCSHLQEELRITLATITRLQAKAPMPDLRKFVKHGEQILSELSAQRDAAHEVFAKEQQNELRTAEAASEDLEKEYKRIKAIYIGIGDLWEHENEELWKKTYNLCRVELVRIKEEQKVLENHSARDEEKVVKRQWDGEKMLMKQIKYYEAILKLAKSEVISRWGDVGGLEEDSESASSSESD